MVEKHNKAEMNSQEKQIDVAVLCSIYNHEKYIRQCLEGIVSQKTDFTFRAFAYDDASTDGTADIVREFAERYPDKVSAFCAKENSFNVRKSRVVENVLDLCEWRYLAIVEGDDMWTDILKLQRQFDWMEAHPSSFLCAHGSQMQFMDTGRVVPFSSFTSSKARIIEIDELMDNLDIFHTSSFFFRREMFSNNAPFIIENSINQDFLLKTLAATMGPIGYLPQVMSLYRKGTEDSWTEHMLDQNFRHDYHEKAIIRLKAIDAYTEYRFSEAIGKEISRRERALR